MISRHLTLLFVLALTCGFGNTLIQAGDQASDQLEQVKSLAGEWRGPRSDGKVVTVSYEVVSGGSAVLERIMPPDEPNMLTLYHLDGNHLMMTHYCAAQNQPRMKAEASEEGDRKIRFAFLDATNLAKPTDGHMRKLVLILDDGDKLKHEWTFRERGQEHTSVFDLKRVEMSKKLIVVAKK